MKKIILVGASLIACICFSKGSIAQPDPKKDKEIDYKRSSLTMVLIEDNDLGKDKDLVINSYNSNPFPDKYNNHQLVDQKLNVNNFKLSTEDFKKAGFYKDTLKTPMDFLKAKKKPFNKIRFLNAEKTLGIQEPSKEEITNIYIDKYIKDKKIAKQIVATWLNKKSDGSIDIELLKQRGIYSASYFDKGQADNAILPTDILFDMGLMGNSYVVFNKLDFYENEPVARLVRDAALAEANIQLAGKPEIIVKKAIETINKAYDLTKEGYTVKCNTYLYQLEWNEGIAERFKNEFFKNKKDDFTWEINKTHWDTTNLFKMSFVGKTVTGSIVVGGKKSLQEIIDLQVKRTMDNAMAKLQKEYVQFRPVVPVLNKIPITAKIGLKDGIEAGQKFEILQKSPDKKRPGLTTYKVIGSVKVNKKEPIWDNRNGVPDTSKITYTSFKGSTKESGVFIRLKK